MVSEVRGTYDGWIGHDVYDSDGNKIGEITDVYYDDVTNRPEWVEVKTGFVGGKRFIPLLGSKRYTAGDDEHDDDLQVHYTEAFIKGAPKIKSEGDHLSPAEEKELWAYYEYDYDTRTKSSGYGYGRGTVRADKDFESRRWNRQTNAWDAPGTMVEDNGGEVIAEATAVSEDVRKVQQPETVRLRKYQHTEMVPVTKEEIRIEKDVEQRQDTVRSSTTERTR